MDWSFWWSVPPIRWAAYLLIALAVGYVVWARVWRWIRRDGKVTWPERIIASPFDAALWLLSWTTNWLLAPFAWRESGLPFLEGLWEARPRKWDETLSQRIDRTYRDQINYPPLAVWIARKVHPWMRRHDPQHFDNY